MADKPSFHKTVLNLKRFLFTYNIIPKTLSQAKNSYICVMCNGKYTTRNKANHSKTKKHILALNKINSNNNSNNNTRNRTCIEERANELREDFEIIQKILDKSVKKLSNDEIDILVKIWIGNPRSVPITCHPRLMALLILLLFSTFRTSFIPIHHPFGRVSSVYH